jgi:hypothetical protein
MHSRVRCVRDCRQTSETKGPGKESVAFGIPYLRCNRREIPERNARGYPTISNFRPPTSARFHPNPLPSSPEKDPSPHRHDEKHDGGQVPPHDSRATIFAAEQPSQHAGYAAE